jgi:hypothetical protein
MLGFLSRGSGTWVNTVGGLGRKLDVRRVAVMTIRRARRMIPMARI